MKKEERELLTRKIREFNKVIREYAKTNYNDAIYTLDWSASAIKKSIQKEKRKC